MKIDQAPEIRTEPPRTLTERVTMLEERLAMLENMVGEACVMCAGRGNLKCGQCFGAGLRQVRPDGASSLPNVRGIGEAAQVNREIVKMNLVGLGPELRQRIRTRAGEVIKMFDGAPENVPEFREATELWSLIDEIDAEASADGR